MTESQDQHIPTSENLSGRVARGAVWILGAGLFARLIGTFNTIIVARLLVPEDFGLVAVATVAMQLLQGFSDIGVSQAVVKFQNASRRDLDTLFTLSVIRGLLIGAILMIAAPFMVYFFEEPRMLGVFIGIAFFPIITGFVNPKFFEFERDLNFSREFISTVLNKIAAVIVSIAVAYYFRTYWAIILGMLTGGVFQVAISYILKPNLPRFTFGAFHKVIDFSGWMAGVSFMAALNNKLDVPILARITGGADAGVYFMGQQLTDLATIQLALPLTRAIYPGMSSLQTDPERMRRAYLSGVSALGAVALPAAFGLSFVAEDFIQLVLGDQWKKAVQVLTIMGPIVGLQSIFYATQAYAVAMGLTRLVFAREVIFFLIRLPVFAYAASNYGLGGVILAVAGLGIVHICLNLALYARTSGKPFWQPMVAARRSLGAGAAMTLYFSFIRPLFPDIELLALPVRLVADVIAGAGVYILAHSLLWLLAGRPDGIEQRAVGAMSALRLRFAG